MTLQPGDEYLFPDGSVIIILWVDEVSQHIWVVTSTTDYVLPMAQWKYIVTKGQLQNATETRSTES